MAWQLRDTVYYKTGITHGAHVAAFDFDHTLTQSDSGLIFMRTENDWTPTTNGQKLVQIFRQLTRDNWTIVIFTNQLQNDPEFTRKALVRIRLFLLSLNLLNDIYVYVSIADDNFRKPRRGMWDMFLDDTGLIPTSASFYCGDAFGQTAVNPLYRWATFDFQFAENCRLAYYTPEEILGTFTPLTFTTQPRVLLIMAAHESQYRDYVNQLLADPNYVETNLTQAVQQLEQGRTVIVTGERFANRGGRRRAMHIIPKQYHANTFVLMFTRPIRPFLTEQEFQTADYGIRGYANALDVHPQFNDTLLVQGEPFQIIRIN